MKIHLRSMIIGSVSLLSVLLPVKAALLVHEGFNYTLADNTPINGTSTTATGLSGDYSASNSSGTAVAVSNYRTAGLSFGSSFFATTGGSLNQRAAKSGVSYVGAALDTASMSGELWGSYLFNFEALNSVNTTGQVRLNATETGGSGSSWFNVASDISGSGQHSQISYNGSDYSSQSSFAYSEGTTYLLVSKFTNVGSSLTGGDPGVASLWMFTQSNYEAWVAGGGDEASLTASADGFASKTATSGSYEFDDYLQLAFYSTASNSSSLYTDEIRYGTTLGDVVAVPEPSTLLMLLGGFSLLVLCIRRRV
ncbi:PEP-CTERM sorting domain-containing protein [Kiritimatiellota bacterium B12222]|nr:PEP-CTERM sorting domain-containing protein [Kiritimatiellota bacterium B12222]